MKNELLIEKIGVSRGHELIDSGDGEKLERFGEIVLRRPDPQALWRKNLMADEWERATAYFVQKEGGGAWKKNKDVPQSWEILVSGIKFQLKFSSFKHIGVFPEQAPNWEWIRSKIKNSGRTISVLNLFGYTGGATLAVAQAGAEVCHVDGSKVAIEWAKKNADLNGLADKPIRWILDDAAKFVAREIRRGKKYDGIIMDPPAYGHGAGGEVWKIEKDLLSLVENCAKLLFDTPIFFLINGYASGYSPIAYKNILENIFAGKGGQIEVGELVIKESKSDRLLPSGIFARWKM